MFRAALGLILALPVAAAAQATAPPESLARRGPGEGGQPVFRAGVEIVRLDVRAVDSEGRPVKDLRLDEIEVLEEGARRPIVLFQHIEEPAGTPAEVARRTVLGDVSTNRGALRGHLYVLLFDQQHITAANEQRTRHAAERFLRGRLRPGDRVAIFGLPGPGPQLDFTADLDRAAAALAQIRGAADAFALGPLGGMRVYEAYRIQRGDDDALSRVFARLTTQGGASDIDSIPGFEGLAIAAAVGNPTILRQLIREDARTIVARADEESRRFLMMLADVVRALRVIEGRKVVMVFSEGFVADNLARELEHVSAAAAQSSSVIYGFDLNPRGPDPAEEEARGGEKYAEIQDRIEPLATMAVETDGMFVNYATQQLDRAFDLIAQQSQDYYLVGFTPHPDAIKDRDRYRRITVRASRGGVRLATRTGYALAPKGVAVDRRAAINTALAAPFPHQGLPVEYTTYQLRGQTPGLQRVILSLGAELPVGGNGLADVIFAVRSASDGRIVASGTDTMPLPPASSPGSGTGVGTFRVQFELPPGDYLMRAVVREPGGLVGSADRRFTVRALDGPALTAGDLILNAPGSPRLPVRTVAYTSSALTGLLELYARAPWQLHDVHVDVELLRTGSDRMAAHIRASLLEMELVSGGVRRVAQFDLGLAGVEPGGYVARARVRAGDEVAAELVRDVEVVGTAPPADAMPDPGDRPATPREILKGELAREYIKAIGDAAPGTAEARGAALAAAGSWDQVEPALGDLTAASSAGAHALRGLARFAAGDHASAVGALERSLEAGAPDARAAFLLGWVHASAGDDRRAVTSWRHATVLDSSLVPAYLAVAHAYRRLDQPGLAAQTLRAGLAVVPSSLELREALSQLERR